MATYLLTAQDAVVDGSVTLKSVPKSVVIGPNKLLVTTHSIEIRNLRRYAIWQLASVFTDKFKM